MHEAPLKFYIQEGAVPHAIHVPPSIPENWRGKVMDAIKKDVALGVLEKVPPNTPSTWCHRMVITCNTEMNAAQPPSMLAMSPTPGWRFLREAEHR